MPNDKTNKPLSTFLDFELHKDNKSTDDGFGIKRVESKKLQKSFKTKAYVVCPCCGLNRALNKTGNYYIQKQKIKTKEDVIRKELRQTTKLIKSKAKKYNPHKYTSFNIVNIVNEPFIYLMKSNGRGKGFSIVESFKMSDISIMDSDDQVIIKNLLKELREQCQTILNFTENIVK